MKRKKRIAVVGLYRSGSSALAGVLHHLGVKMGSRYWGAHYEDYELADQLRKYWNEPAMLPASHSVNLECILRKTIDRLNVFPEETIGAKHPLLSLSCQEIVSSWGADTIIVRSCRDLEESINSLGRTGWGWPDPRGIQQTLFNALDRFEAARPMVHCDYERMLQNPRKTIDAIVAQLELECSDLQLESAVSLIVQHRSKA